MSKIKSEKAKNYINDYFKRAQQLGAYLCYCERAVMLAEQDAEERALKAAGELYEELNPIFLHPMKKKWVIDKFKEFLNED